MRQQFLSHDRSAILLSTYRFALRLGTNPALAAAVHDVGRVCSLCHGPQVRELRMRDMRSLSGSSAHIQRLITADTRRLGTALREVRVSWVNVPGCLDGSTPAYDSLARWHGESAFGVQPRPAETSAVRRADAG